MITVVSDNAITRLEIHVQIMGTYVTRESSDSIIIYNRNPPSFRVVNMNFPLFTRDSLVLMDTLNECVQISLLFLGCRYYFVKWVPKNIDSEFLSIIDICKTWFYVYLNTGLNFLFCAYLFLCVVLCLIFVDSPGAPQALVQSCLTFGAFSFIIEGLNKQQPALAFPISTKSSMRNNTCPPLTLPLQFPLPDEMNGAFSFFYESLKKHSKGTFPTSHWEIRVWIWYLPCIMYICNIYPSFASILAFCSLCQHLFLRHLEGWRNIVTRTWLVCMLTEFQMWHHSCIVFFFIGA